MYLTKHEIITITTLLSLLLMGGLASIVIFILGFVYLQFINKKTRYHIIRNDSQDALMLEGGMSQKKSQFLKLGLILILWATLWYFRSDQHVLVEVFEKGNIRYEESFILNFLEFWGYLVQLTCFVLTIEVAYRIFDSSVNSEAYTKREIMLAGSLLIEVISGIYYFYHWFMIGDRENILDGNMTKIIVHIIIFSAVAATIMSLIVYGKQDEEAKDERDLLIEVKGYKYGFYAITTLLALLIGQMALNNMGMNLWAGRVTELTMAELANLLLFAIIAAWAVVSSAQLFFYRRGY